MEDNTTRDRSARGPTGQSEQPQPGQLEAGHLLAGRYRVECLIGRGGMAEVYRGEDERLARPVALKLLRGHYQHDPALRTRFEEEARAAAMVSHPNVIGVYDAGEDEHRAFIVMELVAGETLADRIQRGPIDSTTTRGIGAEILDALAAAHARGVLHRDIKPANVLLTEDGNAKVADFGIAKAVHPSPDGSEPTTMNVVFGTPSYLAPERAQGHPATARSDLWAVGVLLYEALTGAKPFEGDTPLAVTLAAQQGRHVPLLERAPGADPALAAVAERAMSADPAARFASAADMARAIRASDATATIAMGVLGAAALADFETTQGMTTAEEPAAGATRTMALGGVGAGAGLAGAGLAGAGLAGAGLAGAGLAGAGLAGAGLAGAGSGSPGPPAGSGAGSWAPGTGRGSSVATGRRPGTTAGSAYDEGFARRRRRVNTPAILAVAAVALLVVGLAGFALAGGHHGSRHGQSTGAAGQAHKHKRVTTTTSGPKLADSTPSSTAATTTTTATVPATTQPAPTTTTPTTTTPTTLPVPTTVPTTLPTPTTQPPPTTQPKSPPSGTSGPAGNSGAGGTQKPPGPPSGPAPVTG